MSAEELIAVLQDRPDDEPVRLHMERQGRGDTFVVTLARSPALAGVRELRLAGNDLGPAAMNALAAAASLACLERLDVSDNPLTDQGFVPLCAARSARQLRELILDDTELSSASLVQMHGCVWSAALRHLSLRENDFDMSGHADSTGAVEQPGTSTPMASSQLAFLDLSETYCRAVCLAHLRDVGLLETLRTLRLEGVFGPAEARVLAHGTVLENLTVLQLYGLSDLIEDESGVLGDAGVEILASSPMLTRVQRLELPLHNIGDRGAAALARSPYGKSLQHLGLRGNSIGDAGARALMDGTHTRELAHLNLLGNLISPQMGDALRAHYGDRVQLGE